MKHIKLTAELHPDSKDLCIVTIREQTHLGNGFSLQENDWDLGYAFALGNSIIYSQPDDVLAEPNNDIVSDTHYYFQLLCHKSQSDNFVMDAKVWPNLKHAVEAYNEFHKE